MVELSLLVKATVILATALVAARGAMRARASVRALLLASAFGVLLLLPLAGALIPARTVELPAVAIDLSVLVLDPASSDGATPSAPPALTREPRTPRFRWLSLTTIARMVWGVGTIVFAAPILVALWRLRRMRRDALPWFEGRALFDDVVRQAGVRRSVEVFLHEALAAPMTCGLFRPAVGLPMDALSWTEAERRHALVHEMEHVCRRDWPVHLLARLTCAAYWFHPLAWIAWRQLALESERACDDAVLRGAEGTAYAEQLVTLARRISKHSPVPMLSMADRSNLSTRVNAVLDQRVPRGRTGPLVAMSAFVAGVAIVVVISPLQAVTRSAAFPVAAPPQAPAGAGSVFEVASVRPNNSGSPSGLGPVLQPGGRVIAINRSLREIIRQAYGFRNNQIVGGPAWLDTERFDLEGRAQPDVSVSRARAMLLALLADRFQLTTHVEKQSLPVYALVVDPNRRRGASGLRPAGPDCAPVNVPAGDTGAPLPPPPPSAPPSPGASLSGAIEPACPTGLWPGVIPGWISIRQVALPMFAFTVSRIVDREVIDRTGLSGRFDIDVLYTPDAGSSPQGVPAGGDAPGGGVAVGGRAENTDGPAVEHAGPLPGAPPLLPAALQQQLGLKLDAQRAPIDVLVIDRAERPSAN